MPDAHGAFKGIHVPAEAWERVFMTPHEKAFAQRLEQYERMVGMGSIDPGCQTCIKAFGTRDDPTPDTMHPCHGPKGHCVQPVPASHCTCGACW